MNIKNKLILTAVIASLLFALAYMWLGTQRASLICTNTATEISNSLADRFTSVEQRIDSFGAAITITSRGYLEFSYPAKNRDSVLKFEIADEALGTLMAHNYSDGHMRSIYMVKQNDAWFGYLHEVHTGNALPEAYIQKLLYCKPQL